MISHVIVLQYLCHGLVQTHSNNRTIAASTGDGNVPTLSFFLYEYGPMIVWQGHLFGGGLTWETPSPVFI